LAPFASASQSPEFDTVSITPVPNPNFITTRTYTAVFFVCVKAEFFGKFLKVKNDKQRQAVFVSIIYTAVSYEPLFGGAGCKPNTQTIRSTKVPGLAIDLSGVCTENLSSGVVVMKSAQDGA
jgi:hypothetical protein